MPDQTLVIPLRNEALRLPFLFDRLRNWPMTAATEIIFVDDDSTDRTRDLVRAFIRTAGPLPLRLIALDRHQGKGGAVREGFLAAGGDVMAFTDADLPVGLENVEKVFELLRQGTDVVVGARDHPDSLPSQCARARLLDERGLSGLGAHGGPHRCR